MFIIISKNKTPHIRAAAAGLNMHGKFEKIPSINLFYLARFNLKKISGVLYDDELKGDASLSEIQRRIKNARKRNNLPAPIFEKTSAVTEETFLPVLQDAA